MHEGKMVKCDQCDKQFSFLLGYRYLARHKSIEHENFRLKCSICDHTCTSESSMKYHISVVHENNPKVKCTFCEKLISEGEGMKEHIVRCHSGKTFTCKECSKN